MSQTLLAAGRGTVEQRSVDKAGSKPWDGWQNAVMKIGHAVNSQTPTKNMVSTANKTLWDQREQARRLYTTSYIRKHNCSYFTGFQRNDIMRMFVSPQLYSYISDNVTCGAKDTEQPCQCLNDTHLQVCLYLSTHDHAMKAAARFSDF